MKIAVIGGGAAGYFSAISAATHNPQAKVMILEKSGKLLSKVLVSGGGRCNVTHACFSIPEMTASYPRGGRQLRGLFHSFFTTDIIEWFESRGVKLKAEADGRMFPVTDNSETIAHCLRQEAKALGIEVLVNTNVDEVRRTANGFVLEIRSGQPVACDKVIVASGGSPKASGLD
ncbi:MAG: NAD(P)/FAD-dependent oxidoreductase, partial [Bacteroidota bacterium]|nr:NAD(P)/FAD-dependent oxidoreductase [Bacteroidota bacterium]